MLVLQFLVVTLLFALCSADLCPSFMSNSTIANHDGNFTLRQCDATAGYYSSSPIRPSDGVHSVTGFYRPVMTCCIKYTYPSNTSTCNIKRVAVLINLTVDTQAFSIQVPRPVVIKEFGTGETLVVSIGNFVLNSTNLFVYGRVQSLLFQGNGTWYVNGVPSLPGSYSFNNTQVNVTYTSCYDSIGAQTWYFTNLSSSNAIVEFSSGNVLRSVACTDGSILNAIQCRYQQFALSDGLYGYDSVVPVVPNRTFVPYPGVYDNSQQDLYKLNVSLRGDNTGVSYEYQCVNTTAYTYFRIYCQDSYDWNEEKSCVVSDTAYQPGENLYSNRNYKGTIPNYPTCISKGLSVNSINNNLGFNYFCVSKLSSTNDISTITNYTCLYITNVHVRDIGSITYYYVGISFEMGNIIYGVEHPPLQYIHLNVCHHYDIYNIKGVGAIYNITDNDNFTLATGGLAISGGNGLLAFRNNGSLYAVKPCESVLTQAVLVNGTLAGLYLPLSCNVVETLNLGNKTQSIDGGCLVYNSTHTRSRRSTPGLYGSECTGIFVSIGKSCIYPNSTVLNRTIVKQGVDTTVVPLLNVTANVSVPLELTLAVTTEYFQTQYQKVVIDCARYVCGESLKCRTLLQQYGSFCSSVNSILAGVNTLEDDGLLSFVEVLNSGSNFEFQNYTAHNMSNLGGFDLSLVLPNITSGKPQGRSAIEDLLFNKVTTLGFNEVERSYDKCMDSRGGKVTNAADLTCAQYYNGVLVLPGVVDPTLMGLYTTSLLGGMAFGGITAAAAIPFATQVQARINYLALTQSVLMDNQNLIANSFNKALKNIQSALDTVSQGFVEVSRGFESVSMALTKIQDVVNTHSDILNKLMAQLNVNFGAISSSLQDIYAQLGDLSANAQVDRLITGRLTALSTYVTSLQLAAYKAEQSRRLAMQKIEECVKSQSLRYGFCGNGSHVLTIPQSAPNGIFFIHYTYQPVTFRSVLAVPGLCVKSNTGQYGLMPRTGAGIIFLENGTFYVTSRTLYQPKVLSYSDVVNLTSCEPNYYNVNQSDTPFQPELPNFDEEFEGIYTELNTSKDLINNISTNFNYSVKILDLQNEICMLNSSIQQLWNVSSTLDDINSALNDTFINLEQLNKITRYIKWPWYVWLAIGFACVIFILILGWVFFMTGCCGCCCGCFGIIPLMSKCGKKSSYYTTFDNDVVTEQYRPKKSV
uniref:Putative spike glycoprotein n=1 Tax=Turkey enteric coronavirus TaxID=11152 RepID=E6YDV7_CVTKE|nr:putative spike glycoprotein precursor [Turkey coronavirus]